MGRPSKELIDAISKKEASKIADEMFGNELFNIENNNNRIYIQEFKSYTYQTDKVKKDL